jgi:hypothetical protein
MGLFGTKRGSSPPDRPPLVIEARAIQNLALLKKTREKRKLSRERLLSEKTPRFLL